MSLLSPAKPVVAFSAALLLAISPLLAGKAPAAAASAAAASAGVPPVTLAYPAAPRDAVVDDYHGTQVADPYRWLEDIDSPQTRSWVTAEGELSRKFLDSIAGRESMTQRLKDLWDFERWTPPIRYGENWFYSHNDGLQNQSVVFVMNGRELDDPAPGANGRLLLDPNTLSADGTMALRETAISADGRLFAYALSEAGSDWQVWRVRDVASGTDLPDTLKWSKAGGGSWRHDGSGFYYTAYDPPHEGAALKAANEYEKLYFHKLGTPQASDELIYTRTDNPGWFVGGKVTDDGRYLVIQANLGTDERNTILVQDLTRPHAPPCSCAPMTPRCATASLPWISPARRLNTGAPSCLRAPTPSTQARSSVASCWYIG
jgi:prolyl oligopeptidase